METKRQQNPEHIDESQKSDYCEMNEAEMKTELDVVESRVKMSNVERDTETIIQKQVKPTACEAERPSSEEDASYENREYDNVSQRNQRRGNEGITVYENDFGFKESQTDRSPSKQPKNKNYTILDPSTRVSSTPPSVYKRLKSKPFKPTTTKPPVTCVKAEEFLFDSVDVEYCSIEGLKPKLPTPESSSLGGSSNWMFSAYGGFL